MWFPNKLSIFLAATMTLAFSSVACGQIRVGDRFPSLSLAGAHPEDVPATAGKLVLVDFWASWCAPCKASFPAYARLNADYAARGLVIVAVSVDDDPAAYAAFAKKLAPPFFILRDEDKKLVRTTKVPAMPTSYLVDRHGKIRFIHVGFHSGETERTLHSEIDGLLAENTK